MNILKDHPQVERLLQKLLKKAQATLDERFVGMYLFGCLTSSDFDEDSDIDVVVFTAGEISEDRFFAFRAMHEQIYAGDSPWTTQLEVSYILRRALRRYDPADAAHPHIDRGSDELFIIGHDESRMVQRQVLRERGTTLAGPAPQTLIDPVSRRDLREAMVAILNGWAAQIL
jgi:predicted nucleotidyltransferase